MTHNLIVVGLGFGDEGKGSVVDYLCREHDVHTVVRFNGGAQAAHNVVEPDGRHHTFAQYGSGTLAGVRTHLSKYMLVNPIFLKAEEKGLSRIGVEDPTGLLTIDEGALVTNPFQVAFNRLQELHRDQRHGSCGMGIGETVKDNLDDPENALRVQDLKDADATFRKLTLSRRRKVRAFRERRIALVASGFTLPCLPEVDTEATILHDEEQIDHCVEFYRDFAKEHEIVPEKYSRSLQQLGTTLVYEGAQGVLLDEDYGFHPYTTWSYTTPKNAFNLIGLMPKTVFGVLRGYLTRHGAGPFPTENEDLTFKDHNGYGPWQESFRFGHFDMVLARYAQKVAHCDSLVLTCLDHLEDTQIRVCDKYKKLNEEVEELGLPQSLGEQEILEGQLSWCNPVYKDLKDTEALIQEAQKNLKVPVVITSHGPTYEDKRCR